MTPVRMFLPSTSVEWPTRTPGTSVIADYTGGEDRLVVLYDPAEGQVEPEIVVQVDGADALILLDGQVLARVSGGAGLTLEDVQLQPI